MPDGVKAGRVASVMNGIPQHGAFLSQHLGWSKDPRPGTLTGESHLLL